MKKLINSILWQSLEQFWEIWGQLSKDKICHAEAWVENIHSGKMAHISISMCDN